MAEQRFTRFASADHRRRGGKKTMNTLTCDRSQRGLVGNEARGTFAFIAASTDA
jgi:hypothetical protein